MLAFLIFLCVFFPVITGAVAFMDRGNKRKRQLVTVTGMVLTVASLAIALGGSDSLSFSSSLAAAMGTPLQVLDLALLCLIGYIGWRRRHVLIMALAALQLAGMALLDMYFHAAPDATARAFTVDSLSITLVLVVSIIGSIIAYYALGYMKEHEEHLHLETSKQPRFFAIILIFLGAMNGLALADDLSWVYFFWEVTTLCSYLLIAHDGTDVANTNAERALWMNMAGGVFFVAALLWFQSVQGTLSLVALQQMSAAGAKEAVFLLPVVALCIAGFTKSAQVPFQSWLCGAMVAPTPVSALLHSSTMVKAGVYLILRLAPLSFDSTVSTMVAVCGGFTFLATAALAAGQSNGKKILAYSTISNLGLIIACAGINTPASIAAGMMLLVFHAISKGLLFLCVGAIEQRIHSRDIEDMRGLFQVMPKTALITVFGIVTMMLPPFGMLLGKWMALESSVSASAMPVLVIMLALGSGLTVLFWARWAGVLIGSANLRLEYTPEEQDSTIACSLKLLAYGAAVVSLFAPVIYLWGMEPAMRALFASANLPPHAWNVALGDGYSIFAVYFLYAVLALGFRYAWKQAKKHPVGGPEMPYMSGIQASQDGVFGFIGPMKGFVESKSGSYYLDTFLGENRISRPVNYMGLALFLLLLGGVLQ